MYIFFRVPRIIFCMPSFVSTLFLVYGLLVVVKFPNIFFESSCVESLSLRSFRSLRPWERPMRARSTLEFQPASCAPS